MRTGPAKRCISNAHRTVKKEISSPDEGSQKARGGQRPWMERKVGALGFEPRSAGFLNAGSDPAGIHGSALQLVITGQQTRSQSFPITGAREDTVLPHTPIGQCYALRIFCCRLRRLIFFLRHFHLCLPRFFQAREDLFIVTLLLYSCPDSLDPYEGLDWDLAGSSGISPSWEGFEPETTDLLPYTQGG